MRGATSQVAAHDAAPPAGFPDPAAVLRAHRAVRSDPAIQFDFPQYRPPLRTQPEWLRELLHWVGSLVRAVGSTGWTIVFWVLIGLLALAILVAVTPGLRGWVLGLMRQGRKGARAAAEQWTPEAQGARRLLEQADALAAAGDYDQAVHLILQRSIDDIAAWRGDLVRPSLTSRDIAGNTALPDRARAVFSRIVALVERSLFAGRRLSEADWQGARADYAGFALGGRA